MDSELNSKLVKMTNESSERIKKQKVEDMKRLDKFVPKIKTKRKKRMYNIEHLVFYEYEIV